MYIYLKKICLVAKDNNLPIHVAYMIFDYIKDDYIKEAQYKKIIKTIDKSYNNILYSKINHYQSTISFHLAELPYISIMKNPISIKDLKRLINYIIIEKRMSIEFSHFCCDKTGLMYKFINDVED